MTLRGKASIVGAFEYPRRVIPDKSFLELYSEIVVGALDDAGLRLGDVDGFFCGGDAPGLGGLTMAEYLGLNLLYLDSTETGGSAPLFHVGHAAAAIAAGKCSIAVVAVAGLPRQNGGMVIPDYTYPEGAFETPYGPTSVNIYAIAAHRHMHEYGTTSEQLAQIRVAASHHAHLNPNAFRPKLVTVDEVLASPMVSSPLHVMDCCVITDGGGAVVVVSPEIAKSLPRRSAKILGHGETVRHTQNGRADLATTGALLSGSTAFDEARVTPNDIDYASIYDSFTITVLMTLEDLGFCEKGSGGKFVLEDTLMAPFGALPVNTDGGGLCNSHPNRGGMMKIVEAVRQVRGEAQPEVQVPNCELALAHGSGGSLSGRMGSSTVILGQADS